MRAGSWILAVLLMATVLTACGTRQSKEPVPVVSETGLELLAVELTAGGDLVRLNYRVLDAKRARRTLQGNLFLRAGEEGPWLAVTSAGRLGPMRQRPTTGGKRQFILFTNKGRALARGQVAVLFAGTTRIAQVPVT